MGLAYLIGKNSVPQLKADLRRYNQEHLLSFFPQLTENQKRILIQEIQSIDLDLVFSLSKRLIHSTNGEVKTSDLEPLAVKNIKSFSESEVNRLSNLGYNALKEGKVAAFLVAGGQGSRLDGPFSKGTLDIGLASGKSLFELQAQRLRYLSEKVRHEIPWYIMTSPLNFSNTCDFFIDHNYFGLSRENIIFFQQKMLPVVDEQGRILMNDIHHLSLSPNGNGGCFSALELSGALKDMEKRGIEYVFFYPIDNALVRMADPLFVGYTIDTGKPISSKVVLKTQPEERVGLLVLDKGHPRVIEYSDMPENLLNSRNDNGDLVFSSANTAIHLFTLDFLKNNSRMHMVYHKAHKKIKTIDASGELRTPDKPNGYKFELFMFDLFPYAESMAALMVDRSEEFAPIKNKTGPDSPETARAMLESLYTKYQWEWLL
ncbi:UTP--glucose-1-phosphate uridylyltransferase [Fibrobacterota bacterium]